RERDDSVRAVLAETLGRLRPADRARAAETARTLAELLPDASSTVERGVARGLFFLARRPESRGAFRPEAATALERLIGPGHTAYVRMVAAATLIAASVNTVADIEKILADADPFVREKGAAGLQ